MARIILTLVDKLTETSFLFPVIGVDDKIVMFILNPILNSD